MRIYAGTFLIAASMLSLEIALTRILSVITWYHMAFFAVASAMLGMTAGATTVYLRPDRFRGKKLNPAMAKACLWYAAVTPVSLIVLCSTPLTIRLNVGLLFVLFVIATVACMLPFYFSGVVITLVLTKCDKPIGKLYAADLIGASLGCLLVLGGLEVMDAPSLILACAAIGAVAAQVFVWGDPNFRYRRRGGVLFLVLVVGVIVNASIVTFIGPLFIKGHFVPRGDYPLVRWNSFSHVAVSKVLTQAPEYWGPSPLAPDDPVIQHGLRIDGGAFTALGRYASEEDIEYLRYDVTNLVHFIRPTGDVCVIGVGGGRDIQSAILFGHERVTGVELNPILINLLQDEFRDFAGIADRPGVSLVVDEARSYLSRSQDRFRVVQMSLVDTWAATGAGAFSLSENALYTTEAWKVFISRLDNQGVFTVSRWYNPGEVSEAGRILSLAVSALLELGVAEPSRHIAMVTSGRISTVLVGREPLSDHDLAALRKACAELQYSVIALPGELPADPILRGIAGAKSKEALRAAVEDALYNFMPSTDDSPYFFNVIRLPNFWRAFNTDSNVIQGNLAALLTLFSLILSLGVVSLATIVVPLVVRARSLDAGERVAIYWSRGFYFALIGAGFMFVEIGLIQRLSVFLSHPVYALGILLFTIILSAGIGSYLSERLPLDRSPGLFLFPVATIIAIVAMQIALPKVITAMIASGMLAKIGVSILVIFPLGFLLGFFFPTGMRLTRAAGDSETPWYWALNGIFGVLSSALAVFVAIFSGISTNFYIAVLCYSGVLVCIVKMNSTIKRSRVLETAVP